MDDFYGKFPLLFEPHIKSNKQDFKNLELILPDIPDIEYNPYEEAENFENFIDRKGRKNVTFIVQANLAGVLEYVKKQREESNQHIFQFPALAVNLSG